MLDRRQALKAAAALAVLGAPGRGRADASAVVALSEQRYRYLVDVALNRGAGFRFVLDTGATTHFVSSRVARQLDLPQIDVRTVRGFAGPNRDPVVRAERLRVGGLDLGPAQLVEWPAERLDQFDGLIGYPFLAPRAVVSLGASRIALGPPEAAAPFAPVRAEVTRAQTMLIGGLAGAEGRFVFDTGSRAFTISPGYHDRIAGLAAYKAAVKLVYRMQDGSSRTAAFRPTAISFGDFAIADPVIGIGQRDGREGVFHEADGLFGVNLLRPYAWAVDQAAGTLKVSGVAPASQPLFGSGLQLRPEGDGARVVGVQEGGPAHEAGVRPGQWVRSLAEAPPARWGRGFREAVAPTDRASEQALELVDRGVRRRVRYLTRELV
jgi:hypothetical protein